MNVLDPSRTLDIVVHIIIPGIGVVTAILGVCFTIFMPFAALFEFGLEWWQRIIGFVLLIPIGIGIVFFGAWLMSLYYGYW